MDDGYVVKFITQIEKKKKETMNRKGDIAFAKFAYSTVQKFFIRCT